MTDSGFTVDVDQNQYLPEGGRDVSAVVTVASGTDVSIAAPGAVEPVAPRSSSSTARVHGLPADQRCPGQGGHRRGDRRGA